MKPEFDFNDPNGMWGRRGRCVYRLSNIPERKEWDLYGSNGDQFTEYTKEKILEYLTPCGPPDNAEDYFN